MNGFAASLLQVTPIKGWLRAPENHLTTTELNALLPGIVNYYGAGKPVDIWFQIFELGQFQSFEGNQEM